MASLSGFLFRNFGIVLEDCSPVQAETATAAGHGRPVNSEPDDACTDVEEEVVASREYDASEGMIKSD